MDGVDPLSPASPAPAGSTETMWRLSRSGATYLTAVCVVLLLLYLTGRFLWQYNKDAAAAAQAAAASSSSRRVADHPQPRCGGAAALLSLLPVLVHVGGAETTAECAVCLAEFAEGEIGRALPRCGHGFHEACIATWLRVNTTCPLCRAPVAAK